VLAGKAHHHAKNADADDDTARSVKKASRYEKERP